MARHARSIQLAEYASARWDLPPRSAGSCTTSAWSPPSRKRLRSSYWRFEADQPNQCWQSDFVHWALAGGADAEIINWLDDHSRCLLARSAVPGHRQSRLVTQKNGNPNRPRPRARPGDSTRPPPAIVNSVIDALTPSGVARADMPLALAKVWPAIQTVRLYSRDLFGECPTCGLAAGRLMMDG